jgi:hypothetical protein
MPALAGLLLLAGCAESPAPAYSCLLPAEQHMLVAELFLARNMIDAYKAQFRQQSVGIITRDSCAAF